jgi:hypothetical protein
MTTGPSFTQHVFTPRRLAAQQSIGAYMTESLDFQTIKDHVYDTVLLRLTAMVLTDQHLDGTKEVTLDVPATWWQHFKRDHLPVRYLRWRPVRYTKMQTTVRCEHFRIFPMADIVPSVLGKPVLFESIDWSH